MKHLKVRIPMYFIGLFVMTIGIALSVKSNLGVSAVTCLTILYSLGSVGIGTIIAAVLVGTLVGIINRAFGRQRDRLLGKMDEPVATAEEVASNYVITISREFGSGGREIGKLLAKQLGYHYYDSELKL